MFGAQSARMLFLALLVPSVLGCGPHSAKVSGQLLFDGSPLPAGRITFVPDNSAESSACAVVDESGRFETVLPIGEVRICVDNREWAPRPVKSGPRFPPGLPDEVRHKLEEKRSPPPGAAGNSAPPAKKYVPIPDRYYNIETSGLKITVSAGDQTHDIKLSD